MLFKIKLTLTKPLLGAYVEAEKIGDDCVFERDHLGRILLSQESWYGAFKEAFYQLRINFDPSIIRMDTWFNAKVSTFKRKYNRERYRKHECVETGESLEFSGTTQAVEDSNGNRKEPLTMEQLKEIFNFIGSKYGISPWGKKYGFGAFATDYVVEDRPGSAASGAPERGQADRVV